MVRPTPQRADPGGGDVTPPEHRSPRRRLRDADRSANTGYPKSRFVLSWLRCAQSIRERRGAPARFGYLLVGGSYKIVTEWVMGIELPASTEIGPGLRLRHGVGIVINPATRIGADVMIRQHVTLGNRLTRDDCPVIEDHVEIGAGAVIIGAI